MSDRADAINLIEGAGIDVTKSMTGSRADYTISSLAGGVKLYDYEVVGSDKASIDTFVDDGGSGTSVALSGAFAVLEVWFYARSDKAAVELANVDIIVNNDMGSNYDRNFILGIHTTLSGGSTLADTKWRSGRLAAATAAAGVFSMFQLSFPNYAGTVGNKTGLLSAAMPGQTTTGEAVNLISLGWRSTAAITRVKFLSESTEKFKVGSRLVIFGR